jgi:hypothetical protein
MGQTGSHVAGEELDWQLSCCLTRWVHVRSITRPHKGFRAYDKDRDVRHRRRHNWCWKIRTCEPVAPRSSEVGYGAASDSYGGSIRRGCGALVASRT